jgi:hypothetical protein
MEDQHLEILLRLDESVKHLTRKVDDSIRSDATLFQESRSNHHALAQQVHDHAREIKILADQHAELKNLSQRVSELESYKRALLLIAAGVSSAITLVINKLVSSWPWG